MKTDIHPKYYRTNVSCACGNSFETGSTKEAIRVEICSKCHPFFTGKQKFIDTAGRIEKFQKKYETVKKREDKLKKQRELLARAAEDAAVKDASAKAGLSSEPLAEQDGPEEPSSRFETVSEFKSMVLESEPGDEEAAVPEAAPEVAEAAPEVAEAAPEVAEAAPEVAEAAPEVAEAAPEVAEAEDTERENT